MKKQTNPSTKAYLIRGAFYLLLLIAVCAIPFALAQRNVVKQPALEPNVIPAQKSLTSAPADITCSDYITSTSEDTIVPGDTDTGNHTDDGTTPITLPFPVSLYGTSFTTALVGSNGSLQFTGDSIYFGSDCPLPNPSLDEAILPYQDDLITDTDLSPDCSSFVSGCGVFTSVTGTAPNRVFHIEWRAAFFDRPGTANFEVRFSEDNPSCFDVIYGSTVDNGLFEVSGVQQSTVGPGATTFSCQTAALTNGLKVTYCCNQPSPSPTPTPTATATATATAMATPTATPTPTPTPSQITLTANGYKMRGFDTVDLFWSGATSANIDITRDGRRIATVPNTPSSYTDSSTGQRGPATFIYQVCEAGGGNCSNQVTVRFGGG